MGGQLWAAMDEEEDAWVILEPTRQNLYIVAAMTVLTCVGATLLWFFSIKCLAHAFYCGPVGYPDGGSLMMAFATLMTIVAPVLMCFCAELGYGTLQKERGGREDPSVVMGDDDDHRASQVDREDAGLLE